MFRFWLLLALAAPLCGQEIIIDRDAPESGQILRVHNRNTGVSVRLVNKSPFETCSVDRKREELADASPWTSLLLMIAGAATGLNFSMPSPRLAAAPTTLRERLEDNLNALTAEIASSGGAMNSHHAQYSATGDALRAFFQRRFRNGVALGDNASFESLLQQQEEKLSEVLQQPVPSTAGAEALHGIVLKLFSEYQRVGSATAADTAALTGQIAVASAYLDRLKVVQAKLGEVRTRLEGQLDYLRRLKDATWETRFRIYPDSNAKITGTVSCVDTQSKQVSMDPVAFAVFFQGPPRLGLGAGVLVSSLQKDSIGVAQRLKDGTTNPVTTESVVTGNPRRPQLMPFSLVHIRPLPTWKCGGRECSFNLSPGVGINPNVAGTEGEFFLGASAGIGNVYLSGGAHIGHRVEPGGGFRIGSVLPSPTLVVPVNKPWAIGFGFAVTYRIPLK